ncbi:hypothetical protein GCM10012275_42620 [Longimycelium tulufanense]|uniref:Uncharacterized protein n=1 Tax=Longimycelium tulufanense TaxID=907463 RepID=A0A8J3CAZ8_9PSEU|nr:hypothetical protein [Longimycelium tulufanense]GGM67500.1 hypothetical protein GCM10012275_42620 [Longimycelium tulufanense]
MPGPLPTDREQLRHLLLNLLAALDTAPPSVLKAVAAERQRDLRGGCAPDAPSLTAADRLAMLVTAVGKVAHENGVEASDFPDKLRDTLIRVVAIGLGWLDHLGDPLDPDEADEPDEFDSPF